MVKLRTEKILKRQISRLENLVCSSKRRKFEDHEDPNDYTDTYTLGDVLTKNQGMSKTSRPIDVIEKLADDVVDLGLSNWDRIVDALNLDNDSGSEHTIDWVIDNWNTKCSVRVSGTHVICSCADKSFILK